MLNREKTLALLRTYIGEGNDSRLEEDAQKAIDAIEKNNDFYLAKQFFVPEDLKDLEETPVIKEHDALDYSTHSMQEIKAELPAIIYDIIGGNEQYHAKEAFDRVVEDYRVPADDCLQIYFKDGDEYYLTQKMSYSMNRIDTIQKLKKHFYQGELDDIDLPYLLELAKDYARNEAQLIEDVEQAIYNLKHEEEE